MHSHFALGDYVSNGTVKGVVVDILHDGIFVGNREGTHLYVKEFAHAFYITGGNAYAY